MKKKIVSIILSATMLLGAFSLSACTNSELEAKFDELQTQIMQLQDQNEELQQQVSSLEQENEDLQASVTQQQGQITELEQENNDLKRQITNLELQIDSSSNPNNGEFATDRVYVMVKAEYKEDFLNKKITIEDFCWDNIERIEYHVWYEKDSPESGAICIYLVEHGEKQVRDAVKHFITLDFVCFAGLEGFDSIY